MSARPRARPLEADLHLRVPPALRRALHRAAARDARTVSQLTRLLLLDGLRRLDAEARRAS